ncbi:hypothetical protein E4L96_00335 [Massilia arenosa]|uniref:FecR protein domain-containing protein n=1 Tax=Zemynaea arenosa TaxID=2561931 RepID=A0A4Y9T029_9BURK|nr:FecR family protein [Massilia arenosa]TFW30243.1 hypothetical protein E4L96_00335 [Massilia arenosa]
MRKLILLFSLFALAAAASAEEAGRVVFVAGKAQVATRPAALEAAVQEGDELSTGADGYIYMKTVDNGFLILRPNSRAKVVAYHVDKADPSQTRVKLELLSGVARSISGTAVKQARQNFRFNTPVAAIGVRGTDFIVYTNEQSSWVSVVSGGVVVSGFAGACGPEGGGPCEGAASRELFAGRPDVMLQVQRGQNVPQLLQGAAVAPELNVPARPDEPVGKVAPTPLTKGTMGDVSLDVAKSTGQVLNQQLPPKPPTDPITPPPVVVVEPEPDPITPPPPPPVEVPKGPPEIIWGRWKSFAGLATTPEEIAKIKAEAGQNTVLYGAYLIGRPNSSSFVLPTEGKASFTLTESEAFLQRDTQLAQAASVKDAKLSVDFGARSFDTSLTVYNDMGQVNVSATGEIARNGVFGSSLLSQGGKVHGLLGGSSANEAVYSFSSASTPGGLVASGITRWTR